MEFGDLRITIIAMERVRIEEVELQRLNFGPGTSTGRNGAN